MLKQAGLIAWVIGIGAIIAIIAWSGVATVARAVEGVGWGILLVVGVRSATVSLAGIGWWCLFPRRRRPRLRIFVLLRFVREAINVLLPVAQIGGDIVGAELLRAYRVTGALAAASVVVDVLFQAATQLVFAILGLAGLVALGTGSRVMWATVPALGLGGLLLICFYLAQRRGGQRIAHFAAKRLLGERGWRVLGKLDSVYRNLTVIYVARGNLAISLAVHLAGWVVGTAEVLIVFAFMGKPIGLLAALVIESLMHAIRGAAFVIPSALGAQEGALIVLGAMFNIPPQEAIALSLVKRSADLALGLPGLFAWQALAWAPRLPTSFSGAASRSPRAGNRT